MADKFRVIETYLNVDRSAQVTQSGFDPRLLQKYYKRTETILRIHLVQDDGSYFQPESGGTWVFAIDDTFGESPDPVYSDDTQFNIAGDWSQLDVNGGKITTRVNCSSTALAAKLGANEWISMWAELWYTAPGQTESLIAQWQVIMRNIITDIGSDSELTYNSSLGVAFDGDDLVLYYPDGSVARRFSK